ncbi:hypothetical protein DSO57_1003515 [Entomophthora muscae]|uniref:Uncharacterized protein n=1 Tax=Entomophthora muscae TaxID=34485 RepID=A0ACC2SA96_9FUNG|nr:hypothetical protein DSO57_1003515 [Entomophthora muscae]
MKFDIGISSFDGKGPALMVEQILQDMRCDRCFSKHLRCDRIFPECQQCLRKPEAKCTYLRKALRRRSKKSAAVLRQAPSFGSVATPLVLLLRRAHQSCIIHILTSLQYPCPRYAKRDLSIFVSALIDRLKPISLPAPTHSGPTPLRYVVQVRELLLRAQMAYFEHVNPFMPLFTPHAFVTKYRSNFLQWAVLACGLSWCSSDPLCKDIQGELIVKLTQCLAPGTLKPNLDTLQAILVIAVGMCGSPWVAVRSSYLHSASIWLAHTLGLHVYRRGEELQLAANCLGYYLHFMGLGLMHIQTNIYSSLPDQLDPSLVFAYALEHINRYFPKIIELKLAIVTDLPCSLDTTQHIAQLEAYIQHSSLHFLLRLHRLPQAANLIPVFSFYHSYFVFFVASLALYRSTNTLTPSSKPPPSPSLIRKVATHCARALYWAQQVPPAYAHWNMFGKFSQCILFLVKNQSYFEDTELLHTSYAHLSRMAATPHYGAVGYIQSTISLFNSHPE